MISPMFVHSHHCENDFFFAKKSLCDSSRKLSFESFKSFSQLKELFDLQFSISIPDFNSRLLDHLVFWRIMFSTWEFQHQKYYSPQKSPRSSWEISALVGDSVVSSASTLRLLGILTWLSPLVMIAARSSCQEAFKIKNSSWPATSLTVVRLPIAVKWLSAPRTPTWYTVSRWNFLPRSIDVCSKDFGVFGFKIISRFKSLQKMKIGVNTIAKHLESLPVRCSRRSREWREINKKEIGEIF